MAMAMAMKPMLSAQPIIEDLLQPILVAVTDRGDDGVRVLGMQAMHQQRAAVVGQVGRYRARGQGDRPGQRGDRLGRGAAPEE